LLTGLGLNGTLGEIINYNWRSNVQGRTVAWVYRTYYIYKMQA